MDEAPESVSLTSRWFIRRGCEAQALAALDELAAAVHRQEPDTWVYLVHVAPEDEPRLQSLPPSPPRQVVFFETYRNREAFERHVNGPVFATFVKEHGKLFVQDSSGAPFTTVDFLHRKAGYVRGEALAILR